MICEQAKQITVRFKWNAIAFAVHKSFNRQNKKSKKKAAFLFEFWENFDDKPGFFLSGLVYWYLERKVPLPLTFSYSLWTTYKRLWSREISRPKNSPKAKWKILKQKIKVWSENKSAQKKVWNVIGPFRLSYLSNSRSKVENKNVLIY